MKFEEGQLAEMFGRIAEKDKYFQEALGIISQNTSNDKNWLIGSYLYKNLANSLYGTNRPAKDFDFIVDSPCEYIFLPKGWKIGENRFGNPKFIKEDGKSEIDFVPLYKVHSIVERKIPSTIQNYLNGVPLNIHQLAYNIKQGTIEGEEGIKSLENKIIKVNDMRMAEYAAKLYKTTINYMIIKKAGELGFIPETI